MHWVLDVNFKEDVSRTRERTMGNNLSWLRRFAVTLLIGIVTTLFANVFVSKVIVDTLLYKWNIKDISIGFSNKHLAKA